MTTSRKTKTATTDETLVLGRRLQRDESGVGHCWRTVDASEIPSVREEIEAEIIDGGVETCADFVSGGMHYRW